jgi:carbon starvation protein CstA
MTLTDQPRVVIPAFGVIAVAVLVGLMMYRWGVPQWLATVLGLGILAGLLVVGYYFPVPLPWGKSNVMVWTGVLLVYAYAASITPVNLLLQPRDYLGSLRNRFAATLIIVLLAFYLALGPLALLVLTVILWRKRKPVVYTLAPFVFMLVTTVGALVVNGWSFIAARKVGLAAISGALLVLALLMVADSIGAMLKGREQAASGS